MKSKYLKLIITVLLCQSAGVIGSQFTMRSVLTWYPALNKPFYNPPSWVFAPVWTLLYLAMGISLYLVLQSPAVMKKRKAISIFFVQLVLNISWSAAFFGMRSISAGFIVIILLWAAISLNIIEFRKISSSSAYLLLPYLAWVSFAALLNLAYLILN